jgi:hypothetical protein
MKPLRILHVANRAEHTLGKRYYAFQYKINNGFVRNGHNVYWFSDRDVAKNSGIIKSRKFGKGICNKKFIEFCKNFRPDVLALSHADTITNESIELVKSIIPSVKVLQYNIDALFTESNVVSLKRRVGVVDCTFMTTAGKALNLVGAKNAPACFIPNLVDKSIDINRNFEKISFDYDMFLMARRSSWIDPHSLRALAFQSLETDFPDNSVFMTEGLWGADLVDCLGRSKIGLNFNQMPPGQIPGDGSALYMASSDRVCLCLGNGLLTFSDAAFSLAALYGENCIIDVESYDEFVDKAKYFLRNDSERIKIAKKGHDYIHAEHNEVLVTKYMIETLYDIKNTYNYCWPVDKFTNS